jgi:hypothetical protein
MGSETRSKCNRTSHARLGQRDSSGGGHHAEADACNWFTEGFDTADLKDAKTLLDELAE